MHEEKSMKKSGLTGVIIIPCSEFNW